jgi:hypothetical protein
MSANSLRGLNILPFQIRIFLIKYRERANLKWWETAFEGGAFSVLQLENCKP